MFRCRSKIAVAKASAVFYFAEGMTKAGRVAVLLPIPGNLANSATNLAKDGMESNIIFYRNSIVYEILELF